MDASRLEEKEQPFENGDKATNDEKPVQLHNTYMYIGSVKQLHTCTVILLIH